jgi:hypothetical protein
MSWVSGIVPYLVIVGTIVLGLFTLLKEWEEYKSPRLRIAVGCGLIILGVLTIVNLYLESDEKKKAAGAIKSLEGQVKAANDAQTANTELFLKSFDKLSAEVSKLQTQAATEGLRNELAKVQGELQRTQKALAPPPKAVLTFTFEPFTNPPPGSNKPIVPSTEVALPILADGTVRVEFSVLNLSDVDALDGQIALQICDDCKFAKEPAGFQRLQGQSDRERNRTFTQIYAKTSTQNMTVDVIPPKSAGFLIGIMYRCRTCVRTESASTGTVRLVR